jgi:hypothetical protein
MALQGPNPALSAIRLEHAETISWREEKTFLPTIRSDLNSPSLVAMLFY